jgi:hypothetical protein
MSTSPQLRKLIDAAAPYWAGEAEVFRTYWTWSERSRETDRAWLALQCFKEVWGASTDGKKKGVFLGPLEQLSEMFPKIDIEVDRHKVLEIAEALWAEFAHYCAFADAYDELGVPGEPKINPATLYSWRESELMPGRTEDDALTQLRDEHVERYGDLGRRALRFTEGGYCTLFSEGMKLAERPTPAHEKADRAIARACARVYDDEFGHMLLGINGLDAEGLSATDWQQLAVMSVQQLKGRILMRNAQFSRPIGQARLNELLAGKAPPLSFDYDRARLATSKAPSTLNA